MQYSYYKLLIGCLVLQVAVDATVIVSPSGSSFLDLIFIFSTTFSNRDATIIDSSVEGQLEYAAPSDACSPIAHPFFVKTTGWRNIVLINGTDKCDFMTKIKNARTAGFEAAILFDPFHGPFNYSDITFPIERSEVNITVVLVSCEDGIKLQNHIFPESWKKNQFVWILPTSTFHLYVILLFVVVFGIFIGGLVLVLVSVYKDKYRNWLKGRANRGLRVPISGVSESAHLLASDTSLGSSASDTSLGSSASESSVSEKLKNELVEALGSVNDVQGSENKRKNKHTMIV